MGGRFQARLSTLSTARYFLPLAPWKLPLGSLISVPRRPSRTWRRVRNSARRRLLFRSLAYRASSQRAARGGGGVGVLRVDAAAKTAQAAQLAATDPNLAAVASSLAKELYGLQVVEANIEDHSNNITRFLVIGDQQPRPSGDDKTSIFWSINQVVGVLYRRVKQIVKNIRSLDKIESRPL